MSPSRSTRERDGVHPQVALEQPAVDALVVLVGRCGTRTRARPARAGRRRAAPAVCSLLSPGQREARRRRRRSPRTRSRCSVEVGRGRPRRSLSARLAPAHACATRAPLVDLQRALGGALPRELPRPARARPPRAGPAARRRRRAGAARRPSRAGSWPSTSSPLCPSRTTVVSPPTAAATTGVPVACASTATRPNDSL